MSDLSKWNGVFLVLVLIACGGSPNDSQPSSAPQDASDTEGIKLNDLFAEELAAYGVPGLDTAVSERIVAYRETNGPFRNYEDIQKAEGVSAALLEELKKVPVDFGEFDNRPSVERVPYELEPPDTGAAISASKS